MNTFKQIALLKRLDYFIRIEGTGTAKACADKLNISRATFFRYRNFLIDLEAPIVYCRKRQSYIYEENFQLNFNSLIF